MAAKIPLPTSNLTMADIRDTLNSGGGNVGDVLSGYFSTNAKINKWSFYKPIEEPNVQFSLTDAQIKARHCGLTMKELSALKTNCNGYTGTKTSYSKDTVLAQVSECSYTLPTTYLRMGDFRGYVADSMASDKEWEDYSFVLSDLTAFENSHAGLASTAGGVNFTIDKTFKQMTKFAINLGVINGSDYNYIGNANSKMLPLPYVAGDGMISGEGWRIAYAVQIPYTTSGTASTDWFLFIGRKTLNTADGVTTMRNYCPPDMSSNTVAVATLLYNVRSKGVKTFTMIPCLVKNATMTFHSLSSSVQRSQVALNADAVIYAMPSGVKSVTLSITTSSAMPQIGNISAVKATNTNNDNYTWVLGRVMVQENPDGTPVNAIVVARKAAITGTFTVALNMKYTTKASGTTEIKIPSSGSGSKTYTISSGSTFTFRGVTYNGTVIESPLEGLYFDEDDVTTFTVS